MKATKAKTPMNSPVAKPPQAKRMCMQGGINLSADSKPSFTKLMSFNEGEDQFERLIVGKLSESK